MDLELFQQAWSEAAKQKATGQGFWDSRAEEFNERAYTGEGADRLTNTLEMLTDKGMLSAQSQVLDIGCGPGKYAVEFARRGKSVIATDVSPKMIAWAEENKDIAGLSNLDFLVADWAELDVNARGWHKKFDLVFAAMCPAINSRATLEKMIDASKNYCFMSHFVERSDVIKDELARRLTGKDAWRGHGKNVYFAFNILWLMGYHPEITYIDAGWETKMSLEQANSYYLLHLNLDHELSLQQRDELASYLQSLAIDAVVTEKVTAKIAWMTWQV
jgi:SAM-dependent methyltransferase